jgi:hypothetical protein
MRPLTLYWPIALVDVFADAVPVTEIATLATVAPVTALLIVPEST